MRTVEIQVGTTLDGKKVLPGFTYYLQSVEEDGTLQVVSDAWGSGTFGRVRRADAWVSDADASAQIGETPKSAQPQVEWKFGGMGSRILWVNGMGIGVLTPCGNNDRERVHWDFIRFAGGSTITTHFKYAHDTEAKLEIMAALDLNPKQEQLRLWRAYYSAPGKGDHNFIEYFVGDDRAELIERIKKTRTLPEDAYVRAEVCSMINGHEILILG